MKALTWVSHRQHRLDIVAGLCEGILTALALAGGKLIRADDPITAGLALRIALAVGASEAFVFFVAHYAELRNELIRAERELNLTSRGRLATTALGRAALQDAFRAAVVATGFSVVGALVPLCSAAFFPDRPWVGIVVALAALALLGLALAKTVYGRSGRWALALVGGGVAMTWMSVKLDILN